MRRSLQFAARRSKPNWCARGSGQTVGWRAQDQKKATHLEPTAQPSTTRAAVPARPSLKVGERLLARLRALRGASLERRIFVVAAASLLPLAILSSVTLVTAARDQKARLLDAHTQTARTLSTAVDSQIQSAVASLDALAASPRLAQADLPAFQRELRELLNRRSGWLNVVLSTPDARQVMNALSPLHRALPPPLGAEAVLAAAGSGRPVVSNLVPSLVLQQQAFGVNIPVAMGGEPRFVLTAVISPASLSEMAARHPVPEEGVVTIVDRNQHVVARSRNAQQWLGRAASGPLLARLQGSRPSGWVESLTLDGAPVYSVYHTSSSSGWSVIIGMPRGNIDSPLRWSYLAFGASIAISVILGLLAAGGAGRTIVRPVRELESSAASVGRGEPPRVPVTALPEVRRVGEALVSAHLQREQALHRERDARRGAEQASKAKDEFLAMLGHELRNPLAAISTAAHLLERQRDELKPLHANAVAIVTRQARHLARMTDDLLDAGRIVLGKIALDRAPMDLAHSVQAAMAALRSGGQLEGHVVSVEAAPAWIIGDATRIEQVTLNLVTNAVKYTPQGGAIRVEVFRDGADAVLRVCDAGLGLDAELLSRVFDLFVQGERSIDRSQGGLGIGLTLVRRLAELHGGTVAARSDGAGCGTEFIVRLPAIEPPHPTPSPAQASRSVPALRIALIEDNEDVRGGLRQLLELDGHAVLEAGDGRAGLALLRSRDVDVALVDIGLPLLGGLEIARTVRAEGRRGLVMIAMSGYGGDRDRARGLESGFDAYLVKPVEPRVLKAALEAKFAVGPP